MHTEEITRLLDAAAAAYRREAAELAALADRDESQSDASGETDWFGQHPADAASDTAEREVDLGLQEDAGDVLAEIRAAKRRLTDGTFGRCETCGRPIAEDRLRVVPWARRCIDDERAFMRSSVLAMPAPGQRAWPADDAPIAEDGAWDPEDDHPVPPAEEAALHAET
jgi:RNA polymerase-binding transcription factor DksA